MNDDQVKREELVGWLRERGHTSEEIVKILVKVDQYDQQTIRESIFDSVSDGTFDIAALIDEALSDGKEG